MPTKPLRCLGYARVSSIAQAQGTSLADQQASIAAYAKARGLKVDRFYVETESGTGEKLERRDQMRALMASVRTGDLVLCDKIDRWSRDPIHTLTSVRDILAAGAHFYAVGDALDPEEQHGDMMLTMRAMLAKEEHKRIRARTVGTRWLLRDAGYWIEGMVPFGYARPENVRGPEKNVLIVVEEKAVIVRRMAKMAMQGFSLQDIADAVGVSRTVVSHTLRHPFITGRMYDSKGVLIEGRHPAILSVATYEKVRAHVTARRHGGPRPRNAPARTDPWILRDVAHCLLCGARMTAAYGNTPEAKSDYYLCLRKQKKRECTARLVRRDACEPAFAEMVSERLCEMRSELAKEPTDAAKKKPVDNSTKRTKLQAKRLRTVEAYTDGVMSREDMRSAIAKIDRELAALDAAERPAKKVTRETRAAMLAEVANVRRAWSAASNEQRRSIVNLLTEKALIQRDKTPVPKWRPIDEVLGNAA